MKKKLCFVLLLAGLLVLCGCGETAEPETAVTTAPTVTEPIETVPADGNPNDVTCKGSYSAEGNANTVVATVGDETLTNGELQAWYWAQVAQYRQEQHGTAPDFDRPLDTQPCEIDDTVNSWQQYFLKQALSAWHSAQALVCRSEDEPLPTEEAYKPNEDNHAKYMTGMPATKVLYGYNDYYQPNSMHQAYLDSIADTLGNLAGEKGYADASAMANAAFGTVEENLVSFAQLYNLGYMYFTNMSYYIEPTEEELQAFYTENKASYTATGNYVDIRHILLIPEETEQQTVTVSQDGTVSCSEEAWTACEERAAEMLKEWEKKNKSTEATFAEMANKNSADTGSALNGGAYRKVRRGQLMDKLDAWCFNSSRQVGDTTVIRSKYGIHILYYSGSTDIAYAEAEEDYYRMQEAALIIEAQETYPMAVTYSAITLSAAEGTVSLDALLYPDIAHERYPEIPLYLQQDYPGTMYGGFELRTNGCGITSMSMIASYFTDTELTPPEMCARYGKYSHRNGTDGMIFNIESPVLGFYLREKTYEPTVAKAALEDGLVVISIQHKGYWTGGGHYIVLESIDEDDMVQVRDSNIFNYSKLPAHAEDRHTWKSITAAGSGYWIFEPKITNIPACSRCGEPGTAEGNPLAEPYFCEKCEPAMLRRETYLTCGA